MKKCCVFATLSLVGLGVGVLLCARGPRLTSRGEVHPRRGPAAQPVAEQRRTDVGEHTCALRR